MEEYDENIEAIRKILKGKMKPVLLQLQEEMQAAAQALEFEKAQVLKQRWEKISVYKRKNTITSEHVPDVEVLAVDRLNDLAIIILF